MTKNSKFLFWRVLIGLATTAALGVSVYFLLTSPKGPLAPSPEARGAASRKLPFPERMAAIRQGLEWKSHPAADRKLSREILRQSLELGRKYLIANQKPEGNFNYQYDFLNQTQDKDDNQVRQAGALWGVSLIHRRNPAPDTLASLNKGFDFFFTNTKEKNGKQFIDYPGDKNCETGTVALVALAIIETLRNPAGLPADRIAELNRRLDGYLSHLRSMQLDNGRFAQAYQIFLSTRVGVSSPYFDGETLLAMCKAARYLNRVELIPVIEKAARQCAEYYTVKAWKKDRDSDKTKGFYQWGSMAFREYVEAGWKDADLYRDTTLALAWWMIRTHRILTRTRNSGYAYEGLASAYALAEAAGDKAAAAELAHVIDRGLFKLTSWQVGGPLTDKNSFLRGRSTTDPIAVGGVMNHRSQAPLRIDVAQHQMHAVLLALETVFR